MSPNPFYELSNPQKRIWLTEVLNNHLDMSNIGYLIQLKGHYHLTLLAQVIKNVVKTNRALQLRFKYADSDKSQLEQYFPDYEEVTVEIIEALDEESLFKEIEKIHRARFDVIGGYMCSFAVFSIAKTRFGFFESAHHLVADGISATIVAREAMEQYHKICQLHELNEQPLPEIIKEHAYADFLNDEKEYITSEKYANDREYWVNRLADYAGSEIDFALRKNKKNSLRVARSSFQIPAPMMAAVESYKTANRFSNFGLFMAALAIYFHRFNNLDDLIIGMPVHNRNKKIFRDMVGMFVSTIPLRITFAPEWSFNDLVAYLKKELWESLKHQAYPYNHLVKDLKEIDVDTNGFLNVQLIELPEAIDDYTEKRYFFSTAYNISQLSLYLNQQNSKNLQDLDIAIDYHADIFETREIESLFKRLMVILAQGIESPQKRLHELTLLEESEYQEIVYQLNDTRATFPHDKTLPQLFQEQVQKTPAGIALEYENITVTYQQLAQVTDQLAYLLQQAGVVPDTIVGMLCERSIEAVVAIWAILKAGGAYLPIDPEYPLDRKNYIMENSGIPILLVEKTLKERETVVLHANPRIQTIIVDYVTLVTQTAPVSLRKPEITPENLAYVIYTSGTTGNPKGTLLRHRNAINYITWGIRVYVAEQRITFPLFTSLSFDLTVTSIFIPLLTGNRLVIYRESEEGLLIERVIRENKVDIIKLTPSHLKIVSQLKCPTSRLKSFIVGGEELKTETAREITQHFNGKINIYNEYGPTETAVGCMIHAYDMSHDMGLAVPIGKPADNVQIYILDPQKRPLPLGIMGEIYIAGQGVARGYLKNDTLTAAKFVDNPFFPGEKMYKSGDLGRWNLDKILEFFGRCDEQVKIRGYRIEPGEIEKQLQKLPGIKDAVILVRQGVQAELCAYLVCQSDTELDVTQLRQQLSRELPAYMIPAQFVQVDDIPLTRNGKVDYRKLETMGKKLDATQLYVEPRNDMETLLADIWGAVLNTDRVGITDNFFELGGDSIKAVQIAARLNDAGKTVNVKDILSHQTIANVCANVDFDSHIRKYQQDAISGQKGITPIEAWFFSQQFTNPNFFNQSVLLQFKAVIDIPTMEKTFQELIARHDGLRMNYDPQHHCLYFNPVYLAQAFQVHVVDLSGVPQAQRAKELEAIAYQHKSQFDITAQLLMRVVLFRAQGGADQLLIILHHLVSDGLTWRILLDDLYTIYRALCRHEELQPMQKTASLLDWYDALVLYRDSGKLEKEQSYWLQAQSIHFSLPFTAPSDLRVWQVGNREKVSVSLASDDTRFLLKEAHESYKTDVQILVTVALVRALQQWTGENTICIEMENHGRHIENMDTSKTTGWFTTMYPLVLHRPDTNIGDEIKAVKEAIRNVPNSGIGYGILTYMKESQEPVAVKPTPIRFNYLGQFDQEVENDLFSYSRMSTGSDVAVENHITAVVEINAMIMGDIYQADFYYPRGLFGESELVRFANNYIEQLRTILDHISKEDDVHFTPSDFDTVNLSEDDLAALFE